MMEYESFRSQPADASLMRRWLWWALGISVLIHLGLVVYFKLQKLENFSATAPETLAPPRFVVKKVTIDSKLLQPPDPKKVDVPDKVPAKPIVIPQDKPVAKELSIKPQATEVVSPMLMDKPKGSALDWEVLNKTQAQSAGQADKEAGAISTALLEKSVKRPSQPAVTMPPGTRNGEGIGGAENIPGRKSIDEALANVGSPTGGGGPVAMPGGALFEHDKAELRPGAIDDLKKLGQLFLSYPEATFIISGHTDWTGTPEYNQRLSERRAEAVKEWLVEQMHIAADRIQTVGKGSAEAIVPADRSVEDQQPNRRVEIVIKTRQ